MHSPFPWSTHPQVPTAVFDANGRKIVSPGPCVDTETAADNAALIAAIPAMVQALEEIGRQNLSHEMEQERAEMADFESAYDAIIQVARAALASLPAPEAAPTREGRHPIERLWRECGLPEYFLGNDGSNTKLYALYDAILALKSAPHQRG